MHQRDISFNFRMASLLWTVLLVWLAAHWVDGADKELGEDCTSSDTCVHPTLETVCDQEKTCKIKHGQTCNGAGHGTLCVAGAECTGNACTCKSEIYTNDASTGKCTAAANQYGGPCPCTGNNLECVDSVCLCDTAAGFNPDLSDGTCAAVGNNMVGKTCTDDASCGSGTHLECVGTPMECTCKPGFAGPRDGNCDGILQQLVGRTCTEGDATDTDKCGVAATTNLGCTANTKTTCACAANYYGVLGGTCYPANNKLGGGCSASTGCAATDANSECSGTPKMCQCKTGYIASSGTCVVAKDRVGRACTPDTATAECSDMSSSHAECTGDDNTTCACKSGYTGSTAEICDLIDPRKVGKLCTPGSTPGPEDVTVCGDPATTFLQCTGNSNTECACISGYTGSKGGDCTKKSDSGAAGLVGSLVVVVLASILPDVMRD